MYFAEARYKNYYQLFNNYSYIVPSGIKKWQEKFPEIFVDWFDKFQDICRFTRDNKFRQFCFRFLKDFFYFTLFTSLTAINIEIKGEKKILKEKGKVRSDRNSECFRDGHYHMNSRERKIFVMYWHTKFKIYKETVSE